MPKVPLGSLEHGFSLMGIFAGQDGLVNALAFREKTELPGIPDTLGDLVIALAPPPNGVAARHTVLSANRTKRGTGFQLFANLVDRLWRIRSVGHDVLSK
ncbi:MAG: hypothetical protein JKZ02_00640 [Erythrobacter sp.]|nr:hypothetical protein [Erythrobacter sp.]